MGLESLSRADFEFVPRVLRRGQGGSATGWSSAPRPVLPEPGRLGPFGHRGHSQRDDGHPRRRAPVSEDIVGRDREVLARVGVGTRRSAGHAVPSGLLRRLRL